MQTIFVCVNTWFVVLCVCISPSLGLYSHNNLHSKLFFTEDIIIYLSLSLRMHTVCQHTRTHSREKKREKKTFSWSQLDLSQPGLGTDLYIFAGHLSIVTPSCSSFKAPEQVRQQGLGFSRVVSSTTGSLKFWGLGFGV